MMFATLSLSKPTPGQANPIEKLSTPFKYLAISASLISPSCALADVTSYEQCILSEAAGQTDTITLGQLRAHCKDTEAANDGVTGSNSAFGYRMNSERQIARNPFAIIPHKMNYILPVTYTTKINTDAYSFNGWDDELKPFEAKYQISFKTPLFSDSLLVDGDGLFVGFTLKSWWQVYTPGISKPFKENNYQPELFFATPLPFIKTHGSPWLILGLEHESNGRDQNLSRSWNRLYATFAYERDNWVVGVRPWWRLPESKKPEPNSPKGDDNPDIIDYMGHFEIMGALNWDSYSFSMLARENFATHKGYIEMGLTFPLWGHIRGYAQYVSGYGESLIDYDINQQRIGIGMVLTDLL